MRNRLALPTVMRGTFLCICLILTLLHLDAMDGLTAQSAPTCLNGGTLFIDNHSFYRCLCPAGFIGTTCKDPDPCVPDPCKNHGTCTKTGNKATCLCLPGYTGNDCGTEQFPCASNPCKTGNCLNNGSNYHCVCPPSHTGQKCQTRIGFCENGISPCNENDPGAVCTDTNLGYTCACSKDNYGFNCESKSLSLPSGGCGDVGEPESYCLCSANGNTVKVPLEQPHYQSTGVKSSDFAAGFVGLLLGWLLGTALLTLYYCCCYSGAAAGTGGAAGGARVGPPRPDTASSMQSESTTLSNYTHHQDSKPTEQLQPYPAAAAGKPPASLAQTASPIRQPSKLPMATVASAASLTEPSKETNIYRASFIDNMAHQVSHRKSPLTYSSGSKDW